MQVETSRKRRNPFSEEVTSESKSIKYDQKALEAKTWAILMKPENRKSTVPSRPKLTAIRRSDTSAADTVKGLASDLAYASCVGCQKSTLDTNACSHCHRATCDRCSAVCENCLYHFCPVCRTVKYGISKTRKRLPHSRQDCILYEGHGDSTFCLSCNEDMKYKRQQEEHYNENTENGMDCDY